MANKPSKSPYDDLPWAAILEIDSPLDFMEAISPAYWNWSGKNHGEKIK